MNAIERAEKARMISWTRADSASVFLIDAPQPVLRLAGS